jgi:hypothetical protein
MASMRGTFLEFWIKPSASDRPGQPGHAYSMLSRPSRLSALYRRDKWDSCPACPACPVTTFQQGWNGQREHSRRSRAHSGQVP